MQIRDRIKELRRVRAADLRPNPRNWRVHPPAQQDALRGVLAEVGYADALLARELEDGTLMLIDGHLRAETTPDCVVPVLVLDVDAVEADKILLTHDPLAAMATVSQENLQALLAEVQTESAAVRELFDTLDKEQRAGGWEQGDGAISGRTAGCERGLADRPDRRPVGQRQELGCAPGVRRASVRRRGLAGRSCGYRLLRRVTCAQRRGSVHGCRLRFAAVVGEAVCRAQQRRTVSV